MCRFNGADSSRNNNLSGSNPTLRALNVGSAVGDGLGLGNVHGAGSPAVARDIRNTGLSGFGDVRDGADGCVNGDDDGSHVAVLGAVDDVRGAVSDGLGDGGEGGARCEANGSGGHGGRLSNGSAIGARCGLALGDGGQVTGAGGLAVRSGACAVGVGGCGVPVVRDRERRERGVRGADGRR